MENKESNEELIALISYLVKHNESHTKELEELAISLKTSGQDRAYEDVTSAISDYRKGNEKLAASLEKIKK